MHRKPPFLLPYSMSGSSSPRSRHFTGAEWDVFHGRTHTRVQSSSHVLRDFSRIIRIRFIPPTFWIPWSRLPRAVPRARCVLCCACARIFPTRIKSTSFADLIVPSLSITAFCILRQSFDWRFCMSKKATNLSGSHIRISFVQYR